MAKSLEHSKSGKPHKGTIKSFDARSKSGYIMPAMRRSSLVFNVVDVKGDVSWIEQGMKVSFDVCGFAAKNIQQDLISYALEKAPEPSVMEVESQETMTP